MTVTGPSGTRLEGGERASNTVRRHIGSRRALADPLSQRSVCAGSKRGAAASATMEWSQSVVARGATVIIPMAKMRLLSQATQLHIDEEDVQRGFVDAECASQIELRSNAACRVAFRPTAGWFNYVHVYGFPRTVDLGPDGGAFVRPLERQRASVYRLSYRFDLRSDTLPGTYRWPLAVALESPLEDRVRALNGGRESSRTARR